MYLCTASEDRNLGNNNLIFSRYHLRSHQEGEKNKEKNLASNEIKDINLSLSIIRIHIKYDRKNVKMLYIHLHDISHKCLSLIIKTATL